MSGKEAVSSQAIAAVVGTEVDAVAGCQLQNGAPGGRDVAILLCSEGMEHQLVVVTQVYIAHVLVEGAVEIKLVDAGLNARKHACLGVVQILAVVDDVFEGDGLAWVWEVVAQAQGEGSPSGIAWWAWGTWRA